MYFTWHYKIYFRISIINTKQFVGFFSIALVLISCSVPATKKSITDSNTSFNNFLDNYYEGRLKLFPLEATFIGDNRYNDQLNIDISDGERDRQTKFFQLTLDSLNHFDYEVLNSNDKLSYDILRRDLSLSIEGLQFHDNYMPVHQFSSLPLVFGQLASGQSAQPFLTISDYDNW
ncbi:hypothetical protein BH10BAC3_BH10BAC3_30420 [soil metagenome]